LADNFYCYVDSKGYRFCTDKEIDFIVPVTNEIDTLEKSINNDTQRFISGYASVQKKDLDGETILTKGLDISYLLKFGVLNWDHKKEPDDIIGLPSEGTKIDRKGFYLVGNLFKGPNFKRAEWVWDFLQFLKKADLTKEHVRNLGMSVEGKYVSRNPSNSNIVESAIVRNVAITHKPVLQETFKTFSAFEKSLEAIMGKSLPENESVVLDSEDYDAVLSVFESINLLNSETYTNFKNNVKCSKSLSAGYAKEIGMTGGSAIREESLDKDEKILTYVRKNYKRGYDILKARGFSDDEIRDMLKNALIAGF